MSSRRPDAPSTMDSEHAVVFSFRANRDFSGDRAEAGGARSLMRFGNYGLAGDLDAGARRAGAGFVPTRAAHP